MPVPVSPTSLRSTPEVAARPAFAVDDEPEPIQPGFVPQRGAAGGFERHAVAGGPAVSAEEPLAEPIEPRRVPVTEQAGGLAVLDRHRDVEPDRVCVDRDVDHRPGDRPAGLVDDGERESVVAGCLVGVDPLRGPGRQWAGGPLDRLDGDRLDFDDDAKRVPAEEEPAEADSSIAAVFEKPSAMGESGSVWTSSPTYAALAWRSSSRTVPRPRRTNGSSAP